MSASKKRKPPALRRIGFIVLVETRLPAKSWRLALEELVATSSLAFNEDPDGRVMAGFAVQRCADLDTMGARLRRPKR